MAKYSYELKKIVQEYLAGKAVLCCIGEFE